MKVSKKDATYRLCAYWFNDFEHRVENGKHTTCSYIRACVHALFNCVFAVVGGLGIIGAILFLLYSMVAVPFLVIIGGAVTELLLVFGIGGWGITIIAIGTMLGGKLFTFWKEASYTRLLKAAKEDKKNKICTIVELEVQND